MFVSNYKRNNPSAGYSGIEYSCNGSDSLFLFLRSMKIFKRR